MKQDSTRKFGQKQNYILLSLMTPMFMTLINQSMITVSLPSIRIGFDASVDRVAWVVTAYALPYVILMPVYGRMSDELGRRRTIITGIAIFFVGTCINLFSPNLPLLVIGRAIQGFGAAGTIPLSIATISDVFPLDVRGRVLGTWNSVGPFTRVVGPPIAGLLIDTLPWRAIFVPVLLISGAALLIVGRWIHSKDERQLSGFEVLDFDWLGFFLLSLSMTGFLFYILSESVTGVPALLDWRLLFAALTLLSGFIFWERRTANPLIDLVLLSYLDFRRASIGASARMFGLGSVGFLIPLYLSDIHDSDATEIGLLLLIQAGALLATTRLGGRLADLKGSRSPVVFGMVIQVGAMVYFGLSTENTPLELLAIGLALNGIGAGFALASLHRAAMSKISDEEIGTAAGLYSMIRFVGTLSSAALVSVSLKRALDSGFSTINAYQITFWFVAGIVLAGVIIATRLES